MISSVSGTPAASPAIETRDLIKRYKKTTALHGLSLHVQRGSAIGFLGPNGAGKTTAVKILLGLVAPTSGSAAVLGAPLGDRDARRKIGYLPELFRYQEWMSAREVLAFHAKLTGVPKSQRAKSVDALIERVGLRGRGDDRVGGYSKGMQQRLGLGVALMGDPELVFLDEPTSALDPVGRNDVREIVLALKARGTTVFLNSHLLTEVERSCDHVAIVSGGAIVAGGSVDEMLGTTTSLRLEAGPPDIVLPLVQARGGKGAEGDWYVIPGLQHADVPAVVRELVAAEAHIFAVEPARATLEQRFLEVLGAANAGRNDRRPNVS